MDIWSIFSKIKLPSEQALLCAEALASGSPHFISKNHAGLPVFLIVVADDLRTRPDIELQNFSINMRLKCSIKVAAATHEAYFAAIRCNTPEPELQEVFVRALNSLISKLGPQPSPQEINELVAEAVELFRETRAPCQRTVTGLWGELFVIYSSANKVSLMRAWRSDDTDTLDFSGSKICFDVKTTALATRVHEFSLDQLRPLNKKTCFVASLMVSEDHAGKTILDLAQAIEAECFDSPDLIVKLWRNVFSTLGQDAERSSAIKFSIASAASGLRYISADDIPCPELPDTGHVFRVRFATDLSVITKSISRTLVESSLFLS